MAEYKSTLQRISCRHIVGCVVIFECPELLFRRNLGWAPRCREQPGQEKTQANQSLRCVPHARVRTTSKYAQYSLSQSRSPLFGPSTGYTRALITRRDLQRPVQLLLPLSTRTCSLHKKSRQRLHRKHAVEGLQDCAGGEYHRDSNGRCRTMNPSAAPLD